MSNGACAHLMGIHRGSEKPSLQVNVDRLDKREPDALPAYNGCGFMSATIATSAQVMTTGEVESGH